MNKPQAESTQRTIALLLTAARGGMLKKAVFSKPIQGCSLLRATVTPTVVQKQAHIQMEMFHSDHKATHVNLSLSLPDERHLPTLESLIAQFSHVTVLTTVGDCELRRAKSGTITLLRGDALRRSLEQASSTEGALPPIEQKSEKKHILTGSEPFLRELGVSDENGRVYDKKQAKFRQINRFLELLRDVESHLPADGPLVVLDLCCGKSYLSFAVYHYLTAIKGRDVRMAGVDLKADVVEYGNRVARALSYDGLHFYCEDVATFTPQAAQVDLVVSLHACDTATDLVLQQAIAQKARVILSTPCCHHELNHTLDCPELDMIAKHSMLRQKLCDAATDAMRLLWLEAYGYRVESLELIDPEETPKNVMLRAVRKHRGEGGEVRVVNEQALQRYQDAVRFFVRTPGEAQDRWLARVHVETREAREKRGKTS